MKFSATAANIDWGLLACFAAKDPNSAPWVTTGQECYTFQMNKANNTLIKTIGNVANRAFTPDKTSTIGVINDEQFHNIKIKVTGNTFNDLTSIVVSVDGAEIYNFIDTTAQSEGGLFLIINKKLIDIFELDTLDPTTFESYMILGANKITNIQTGTSQSLFTSAILPASVTLTFLNVNNGIVGTGTKVDVTSADVTTRYTLLIYGDVNGDGYIEVNDLAAIKLHLLNSEYLVNDYLAAGDIFKKGFIAISDLLVVKKHLLNISLISQS